LEAVIYKRVKIWRRNCVIGRIEYLFFTLS